MIAGLHYILYLLAEICRRVLPGRFTDRAIGNGGSPQKSEETDRYVESSSVDKAAKMKSLRAKPSMVNVNGFGQSIAVLTSGGDAQGLVYFKVFL
jgi:hypothetical protein